MDRVIGLITANYETSHLGVLTSDRTIASLPYGGRYRLVDFPLSNMVNAGIRTVGVITPYKYRSIIDHLGAGKEWSLDRIHGGLFVLPGSVFGVSSTGSRFLMRDIERNLVYLMRSPTPYILVASANTIYNMDYTALFESHLKSGADITMVGRKAKRDNSYLTGLKVEGGRVMGSTKGVKAGDTLFLDCFVISRDLLLKLIDWYSAINYLDLFEVLAGDYDKMDVGLYEFEGHAATIWDIESYYRHSMELLNPEQYDGLFRGDRPIQTKVEDAVPTEYMKGARVSNSLVPNGCIIKGTVENSVLFRGVQVEEGAVVRNSIIMQSCIIEKGACVENAILDRNNTIPGGSILKGTAEIPFIKEKGTL